MGNKFCSRRWILGSVIALAGLQSGAAFAAACAETPAAAARLAEAKSRASSIPEDKGYRVTNVRWDPLMQQSWATIVSCEHPEWPGVSLRTGETSEAPRGLSIQTRMEHSPLVRAGDIVELWRQEDLLRIEVSAVAEQSGSIGETIRVRLVRRAGSTQSVEEQFNAVIRGRANVEMQP